jgi:hypothetical protein
VDDPPLKLVLNSPGNGPGGTINLMGVEVASTGEVTEAEARLAAEGVAIEPEPGAVCRYARHFTLISSRRTICAAAEGSPLRTSAQVVALRSGAGERDRTADLPFTRRLLCQLSYTGGDLLHGSRPRS